MFVLFEGLDLSGKSTLCRELQSILGWELRHNSLLPRGRNTSYLEADAARRSNSVSHEAAGILYLQALKKELEDFTLSPTPFIQDSTILLRSIAFHTAIGNTPLAAEFRALIPKHPRPALAFICRPSVETRLHRLRGRISRGNDSAEDLFVRDNPELFAKMEQSIEEDAKAFHAEFLDTSCLEDARARAALLSSLSARLRSLSHSE